MDRLSQSLMFASASSATDPLNPLDLTIGQSYEGGYFAGYISHTANGVPTHALIVSPRATGGTITIWKNDQTGTAGTASRYDGAGNTVSMANATHPAANFCANLSTGGYSDWYLPAVDELEIAYYNLKPTATANNTGQYAGYNAYSVPVRSGYTASVPAQTALSAFQANGSESFAFSGYLTVWSSTQGVGNAYGYGLIVDDGVQTNLIKDFYSIPVRAFRKVAV